MNVDLGSFVGHNSLGQFIERTHTGLADWFMPHKIGAMIPSDDDIRAAGYRSGSKRPRAWTRKSVDTFSKRVGGHTLWVRGTMKGPRSKLWTSERVGVTNDEDQVLIHALCRLPILNRTYQAAMRLAEFCHPNAQIDHGHLHWEDQNNHR
jgi:hypothetical protein